MKADPNCIQGIPALQPIVNLSPKDLLRFWEKVEKLGTEAGCWLWTSAIHTEGYGMLYLNGKAVRAHRIMWEITYGPVPQGLFVLHRCDLRCCVNPAHLFLGTNQDNVDDMMRKGRHRKPDPEFLSARLRETVRKGEEHSSAKLTEEQALEIVRRYKAGGETHRSLGKEFGTDHTTIGDILRKQSWRCATQE